MHEGVVLVWFLGLWIPSMPKKFPASNILMGEVKLGFVPAIEDARIMLSLTSTKQSTQVASFVEGNK